MSRFPCFSLTSTSFPTTNAPKSTENTAGGLNCTTSIGYVPASFLQMATLLLKYNTNINLPHIAIENYICNTALHFACKRSDISVVQYLIENRIDVNVKNKNLNTPLHFACSNDGILMHCKVDGVFNGLFCEND
eukprot:TRINITY_DN5810_c0_g3_i1.p1 TRINITY_DN5810_c0_g3~~TRINITY_DN5810_c0_g3_i1.p1  ORF type:complete len:134 (+),score=18.16 TRINITY_DN5810_c0_g3_i1:290-691(+)